MVHVPSRVEIPRKWCYAVYLQRHQTFPTTKYLTIFMKLVKYEEVQFY